MFGRGDGQRVIEPPLLALGHDFSRHVEVLLILRTRVLTVWSPECEQRTVLGRQNRPLLTLRGF